MLPFSTTAIDVQRLEGQDTDALDPYDPYDPMPPPLVTIAAGVRAVIGPPTANATLSTGDRVEYSASMRSEPCDIQSGDLVVDSGGTTWTALWARRTTVFGLDFMHAELKMLQGAA